MGKCRPLSHHPLQLILSPPTSLPLRPLLTKAYLNPPGNKRKKTKIFEKTKLEMGLLLMALEDWTELSLEST